MSKADDKLLKDGIRRIFNKVYVNQMDFSELDKKSVRAMNLFLADVRNLAIQRDKLKRDVRNGFIR